MYQSNGILSSRIPNEISKRSLFSSRAPCCSRDYWHLSACGSPEPYALDFKG